MFELLFLGFVFVLGGVLLLKSFFFILGLIFTSVGFAVKIIFTVLFGVILLPLGTLFSAGFFITVLVLIGLGALIRERKPRNYSREYYC